MRIRGQSSAAEQEQKSLAIDSFDPAAPEKSGDIEFMGGSAHSVYTMRLCVRALVRVLVV